MVMRKNAKMIGSGYFIYLPIIHKPSRTHLQPPEYRSI